MGAFPLLLKQPALPPDLPPGDASRTQLGATLTRMPTSPGSPGSPGSPCTQRTRSLPGARHTGQSGAGAATPRLGAVTAAATPSGQRPAPHRALSGTRGADPHGQRCRLSRPGSGAEAGRAECGRLGGKAGPQARRPVQALFTEEESAHSEGRARAWRRVGPLSLLVPPGPLSWPTRG